MALELLKNSQPNSECLNPTSSGSKAARIKAIVDYAIAKKETSPKRSPEEIWEEFDAVWDKIASQA
jgi:hypothetical protein